MDLFDCDYIVFIVENLRFFHKNNLHHNLQGTLVDVEMVLHEVNGQDIPRYSIYDIIKFDVLDVSTMNLLLSGWKQWNMVLLIKRCSRLASTKRNFGRSIKQNFFWTSSRRGFLTNLLVSSFNHSNNLMFLGFATKSWNGNRKIWILSTSS